MKEQHIKWAARHGWYIGHGVNVDDKLFIRVKDELDPSGTRDFFFFTNLLLWAWHKANGKS